jgi:hypothetical protein
MQSGCPLDNDPQRQQQVLVCVSCYAHGASDLVVEFDLVLYPGGVHLDLRPAHHIEVDGVEPDHPSIVDFDEGATFGARLSSMAALRAT